MVVPGGEQNQAATTAMAGRALPFSGVGIDVPVPGIQEMGFHPNSATDCHVTEEDPYPLWASGFDVKWGDNLHLTG